MANKLYQQTKKEYQLERGKLEARDESRWFYKSLGIRLNRQKELDVADHMEELRNKMKDDVVNGKTIYPAAIPFYLLKSELDDKQNELLSVFQVMPKGGLLHVHSSGALSTDGFLELLERWCNHSQEEKVIYPDIMVIRKCSPIEEKYIEGMLLFSYQCPNVPEGTVIVSVLDVIRNPEEKEWLKEKLSISTDKNGKATDIWKEFNLIFARIDSLFTNRVFYTLYHASFFLECIEDRIYYVELRCGFQEFQDVQGKDGIGWTYADRHANYRAARHLYYKELIEEANPENPDTDFLEALLEAQEMVKDMGKIHFRVILNARRDLDPSKPEELAKLSKKVDTAIQIHEMGDDKFEKLVIGFDFVSEEDRGKKTSEYANQIIYKAVGEGYDAPSSLKKDDRPRIQRINFFLHDGESSWKKDDNIMDAAMISKHRIGHGFNMNQYPEVVRTITNRKQDENKLAEPVLEICPISNQVLRYNTDIRNHSAYELMKNGVCCVFANDDPLIFGNVGLSYDYWMAYVGMELPLEAIKASVYIAFLYRNYSYADGEEFNYKDTYRYFSLVWDSFIDFAWNMFFGKPS